MIVPTLWREINSAEVTQKDRKSKAEILKGLKTTSISN